MFVGFLLKVVMQNDRESLNVNLSTNLRRRAGFTLRQIYPRGKNRHACYTRDSVC